MRRGGRFATVLAVVVLMLVAGVPSQAFHNPPRPRIATAGFTGNAWAAYRFTIPAGGAAVDIEVQGDLADQRIASFAAWLLRGDGRLIFAGAFTGWHGEYHELHVESPAGVLVDERSGGADGFFGMALGTTLQPGQYIAVMVATVDGSVDGDFNLYAGAGTTVTANTSGTGAFIHRETDFSGPVNVYANESAGGGVNARVKASAANSITKSVGSRLFALYQASFFDPITVINYEGPNGGGLGSTIYFLHGAQSGDYTFNIDLNAGITSLSGIWLMGADVTLP